MRRELRFAGIGCVNERDRDREETSPWSWEHYAEISQREYSNDSIYEDFLLRIMNDEATQFPIR